MQISLPLCANCKHLDVTDGWFCDAFEDVIPEAILTSEHDHHQPYPGDHGIQFEPLPDSTGGIVSDRTP